MESSDSKPVKISGAPEVQKSPENSPSSKPKGRFGEGGPPGNKKAQKHGCYSPRLTPEEMEERRRYEANLLNDQGGVASTAQKTLIGRAGMIEMRLRRCDRATSKGMRIPDEHILSWINAQRLLLCALGLERKQNSEPNLQDYLREKAEQRKPAEEKVQ